MQYYYKIYGLYICSELIIEEAIVSEHNDQPDVMVYLEQLNYDIDLAYKERIADNNKIQFFVEEVGCYIIEKGNTIKIIALPSVSKIKVKCFLLGSAFGYLMIQRGKVALHGCCVAKDKTKGIIVTGVSGAGKSTIGTSLFLEGYKFVADDVCALSEDENGVLVEMAYPQQKLCKDAVEKLGYCIDNLVLLSEKRNKYGVRLKNPEVYELEVKLKGIFEIRVDDNVTEVHFMEMKGHEKLMAFLENIFRYKLMFKIGLDKYFLQSCLSIIQKVPMYCITRPSDKDSQKHIIEFIKQVCMKEIIPVKKTENETEFV